MLYKFPLVFLAAIMRSFSLLQTAIIPYISVLVTKLTQKLVAVSKVTHSYRHQPVV